MNIIPAIDIYENKCVRLYKGEYDKLTVYSDNPVEVIQQWRSYGAKWIHIIDLEGARKGIPISKELITEMVEKTNLKIQIGGGIRNLDTIKYYFSLGEVGNNFGAGMTGGMAFAYDKEGTLPLRINLDDVFYVSRFCLHYQYCEM